MSYILEAEQIGKKKGLGGVGGGGLGKEEGEEVVLV